MSEGTKSTHVLCNPGTSTNEVLEVAMTALSVAGAPVIMPDDDPFDDKINAQLRKAFGGDVVVAKITVEVIGELAKKEHVQ